MKKIICFVLLLLSLTSFAQKNEEELLQRITAFNNAVFIAKDSTALDDLLADKVSYGHSSGKIQNRQEMISEAVASPVAFNNLTMEASSIYFEDKAAIVRHQLKAVTVDKTGKESPLHIGILQVWVKQKGKWKLTARQAYKL